MEYDIIIVGGGIGGAALATLLARQSRRVAVLERSATPLSVIRPEILWPSSVAMLRRLTSAGSLEPAAMLPVRGLTFERGGHVLLDARVQPGEDWPAYSTDPNRTRALLLASAEFDVLRGVEVTEVLREGRRVVGVRCRGNGGERDLLAGWTVGDDGGNSAVRRGCGIGLDARELDLALVCCAFAWPRWLPAAVGHVWVNDRPGGASPLLFAALPWPEDRGVGLIPVRRGALDSEDSWMRWVQFCGRNEWVAQLTRDTPFQRMARFHLRFGHAAAYGVPGAVLMGDAAHPVTPAGGQGANLSLADAAALAPLLTSRATSDEMIGEYERLRRPAAERSLSLSRRAGQALKLPDALIGRLLPIALALVGMRPKIFSPALRFVSSAFAGRESDAVAGLRPHHCGPRR